MTSIALVAAAVIAMIAWIWNRTPDVLEDYGREVYVAWRLSEGAVLYRDINYFNGPLAPYFNALLFELFGPGILTLKAFNAALIALMAGMMYRLVLGVADHFAAGVCGVVFAVMFACQQVGGATFNFLTPYSHDLTYGVALSIGMLLCLWRAWAPGARAAIWCAATGTLLGLSFLTKPEVFLAAAGACAAGVCCLLWGPNRPRAGCLLAISCGLLTPVLLAVLLLGLAMPLDQAIQGVVGAWKWIGDSRLMNLSFYRWVTGLGDAGGNVRLMLGWIGGYAAIVLPAVLIGWYTARGERGAPVAAAIVLSGMILALGVAYWQKIGWHGVLRPLPIVVASILLTGIVKAIREPSARSPRQAMMLAFGVFSLLLLLKTPLRVQPRHYGFALAMPATLYMLAAAVTVLPGMLERRGIRGLVVRCAVMAAVLATLVAYVRMDHAWLQRRRFAVSDGQHRFYVEQNGAMLCQAASDLARLTRPDATLSVLPEGAMINFLSRRRSATPDVSYMTPEVIMFSEDRMLDSLRRHPPDYIALVHRNTSFFDARYFGQDYGRRIGAWIADNYDLSRGMRYGARPFNESNEFGILIAPRRQTGE